MALANRGLLDGAKFKDVKRSTGHRALALDLQVLSLSMKEQWAAHRHQDRRVGRRARAVELADRLSPPRPSPACARAQISTSLAGSPRNRPHPRVIVSVAHLDDDERVLVLGVLLEEILSWVRTLPGSQRVRALIVFDCGASATVAEA